MMKDITCYYAGEVCGGIAYACPMASNGVQIMITSAIREVIAIAIVNDSKITWKFGKPTLCGEEIEDEIILLSYNTRNKFVFSGGAAEVKASEHNFEVKYYNLPNTVITINYDIAERNNYVLMEQDGEKVFEIDTNDYDDALVVLLNSGIAFLFGYIAIIFELPPDEAKEIKEQHNAWISTLS